MTTDQPRLSIHVLGAAKGESIVIQLPDGRWGVVDCYARSPDDPSSNPTISLLREQGAGELEFLCLTHPHDDHFRGIGQLLDEFPVRYFWHFGAQSAAQFKLLVKYVRLEAEQEATEESRQSGRLFSEIWQRVDRFRRAKKTRLKECRPATLLYPVPADWSAHFRVIGLAPSAEQSAIYHKGYTECFDQAGRFKDRLPREHHNRISIALLLIFGSTKIILGGDVESPGWTDVLMDINPHELAANLVKVSHHGSTTGYCGDLWKHFSASGKPHAVITSYLSQGLPQRRALDHIREHTPSILLTCATAVRQTELPERVAPQILRSRLALLRKMGHLEDEASHRCGRWTLMFDDQGHCVGRNSAPPALDLSEMIA
jgi:beta-lactamase superfamily II metal-dependent hydrolase